jgi:competence protein ComEC
VRRFRLPRSGWLAVGAVAGAGGASLGVEPGIIALAALAAIAAIAALGASTAIGTIGGNADGNTGGNTGALGSTRAVGQSRSLISPRAPSRAAAASRAALLVAVASLVIAGRLMLMAPDRTPVVLPEGPGPWTAIVEQLGSPRDGQQTARIRLAADERVQVAATLPRWPELEPGATIEVTGPLRPPPPDAYGDYLRRVGTAGTITSRTLVLVEGPPPATLDAIRGRVGDLLTRSLPEPEAGLAAGILIGLRERVDRQVAKDFATAGVSHVVAISGWNIAIVAGLVLAVLRGRPRRAVAVVVAIAIGTYTVAAGASPSVVRAAAMAAVVLAARESGRAGRAESALGWAAALLLLADPRMIEDAGFRLSVLATGGLIAWSQPLANRISSLSGDRCPRWLAESLGISLAAQAATLPDVLATFGRLSIVAPAVNLLVVPLVPLGMAGGVLALLGGWIAAVTGLDGLAAVLGLPGWLVLRTMVTIITTGAQVPFAAVTLPAGSELIAGFAVAALLLLVTRRPWRRRGSGGGAGGGTSGAGSPRPGASGRPASARSSDHGTPPRVRRWIAVPTALAIALGAVVVVDAADRTTRLTILDVGQGDAALLETAEGGRLLVDGGPDPDRLLVELDARIPPWDRRIDIVVLTHPHEDHAAGLARVLDRYLVGQVLEPGMRGPGPGWLAWDERLRRANLPRSTVATGGRFRLDEVVFTVLWPDPGTVPEIPPDSGRAINDVSVVLLGEAHGHRFLLTGDIEDDVDPRLLERDLPSVDILKVAHHGSATATTAPLLAVLRPRLALVSAGARNRYGHPAPSTLDRLRSAGARILRTDRDGSIEIELEPGSIAVRATGARTASDEPLPGPVRAGDRTAAGRAAVAGSPLTGPDPWGRAGTWFTCGIPVTAPWGLGTVLRADGSGTTGAGATVPSTGTARTTRASWSAGRGAPATDGDDGAVRPPIHGSGPGPASWAVPTGYDPGDDRPHTSRGRPAALLAPATALADPPLVRRGRCGRVAGPVRGKPGPRGGHRPRRVGGTPPRRGQGAATGRSGRAPPAWRGLGSMARRDGAPGAVSTRSRPSGDATGLGRARDLDADLVARSAGGGLRRQARGGTPGTHGGTLRVLAAPVP